MDKAPSGLGRSVDASPRPGMLEAAVTLEIPRASVDLIEQVGRTTSEQLNDSPSIRSRLDENRLWHRWKVSYPIGLCTTFARGMEAGRHVVLRKKTKKVKRMRRARCASIGEERLEELFDKLARIAVFPLCSAGFEG